MARFYVEKDGEWNIFSTVVDDFILDEFVCLDALKARLLYERYMELTKDIDSLMTDRPRVNVMSYAEATGRMRKLVCDGDCWMKREFGDWLCKECEKTPQPKKCLPDYSYEADMAKRLKQMSYNVDVEEHEDSISVTVHKEEPQAERNSE